MHPHLTPPSLPPPPLPHQPLQVRERSPELRPEGQHLPEGDGFDEQMKREYEAEERQMDRDWWVCASLFLRLPSSSILFLPLPCSSMLSNLSYAAVILKSQTYIDFYICFVPP